jgi:hypothetical protein
VNYLKHYNTLIEKSKHRTLEGYVERHHILPRCMGGGDEDENIAILTPEEHYIAHLLLMHIYPEVYKLHLAIQFMSKGNPKCPVPCKRNKMFGWLRRKMAIALSQMERKERKKETKPRKPKVYTEEWKRKIGEGQRGRKRSEETRKKQSEAQKGRVFTEEQKQKMRKPKAKRNVTRRECPHCLRTIGTTPYARHVKKCEAIQRLQLGSACHLVVTSSLHPTPNLQL